MNTLEKLANIPLRQQRPFCAACRKEMWLIRIEPDEPGYEARSFECAGCGYRERVQTQIP
jgi:RNase P subunit RPR2